MKNNFEINTSVKEIKNDPLNNRYLVTMLTENKKEYAMYERDYLLYYDQYKNIYDLTSKYYDSDRDEDVADLKMSTIMLIVSF